jgi:hypothetical protein
MMTQRGEIGHDGENIASTDQEAIAQRFRPTSRRLHKLAADSQLHGGDAVNDFPELVQSVVIEDVDEPLDTGHMILQGSAHPRDA